MPKTQRVDHVPNRVPLQPGECRDAVHWFVDSVGLYQGSVRGLFLSDYSEDQEALLESAVINFKSRGVTTLVITGEMLYKQADYLFPHAIAQSPFGRPLLSKMELDMLDADVLIVKDLNAPETPQQLWYLYHHLLYPRALSQRTLLISTQLGYEEFLGYGTMCEDLEYAGRKVTWEKVAWLLDSIMIDLHHFRQVRSENLPPMLKVEYYLYKAVASRGLTLAPQYVLGDYSLDFALMERKGNKLAIECDVLASLDQPSAGSADAKRTLVLLSDGWKLLRFTAVELLANLGGCVEALEEAWVHGYKRSAYGRLVSGHQPATVLDLPVEDDVQRLAITNGAGPVAITGGAGTGKSSCITRRIVHLLTQGVNAERILVVSHSTDSVRSLKAEVEKLMDRQQAQKVAFFSWNELGLKLLKENTAAIKRKPPLKVEANPQRIIQRLLTKFKKDLDQLTLELSEELEEFTIASLISLYKANLVTPKHVKERAKGNVDELVARVYQGYEEQLQKSNKIDRDDMVSLAAQLLADNADIRARYQYQYEFVLVDEFQDATAAADLLARILALPQDNLYIAGDEDESIFESKGALPRILSEVSVRLPNARCYVLERNWRCHPSIVNHARLLLGGLHRRKINKDMVPGWDETESQAIVGPFLAESEAHEAEWVASQVQQLLDGGRNPQEIAILYRYNRYASMVEEALFRKGIKCLTTNPDSTMVPDEVADVMAFLRLVMDPDGPKARESFERVCQLRSKEVDPKLFGTIASFAEANNLSFLKAVEIYSEAVADQSCMDLSQLVRIIRTMNHENLPPSETIALLKRTQRLTEYYKSVKVPPGVNYEPMRKLAALEEEARKFKTVTEFVRSQQNLLKANEGPDSEPLVYILSLHEAKGKEYPIVFLTGMAEGLFPSETANDPEEERRLCYLGFTRAREVLYLSYPNQFNNIALEPSRYLFDAALVGEGMEIMQADTALAPALPAAAVNASASASASAAMAEAARLQQEAKEAELKAQQAALKAEQEAQRVQQEQAQRAQQAAALKAQQEALVAQQRAQQEQAMKAQQELQEQQLRAQHEAAVRAQQAANEKIQAEQKAHEAQRLQQEQLLQAQHEAGLKAEQEQKLRAQKEQHMRQQQEQQQQQLARQQAELKIQQEQQLHLQQQISLRSQQDERMRLQQEAQLRSQEQAQRQAQQEIDLRSQHESQVRARLEAAQKSQQEERLRAAQAGQSVTGPQAQQPPQAPQDEHDLQKQVVLEAAQIAQFAQEEEAAQAAAQAAMQAAAQAEAHAAVQMAAQMAMEEVAQAEALAAAQAAADAQAASAAASVAASQAEQQSQEIEQVEMPLPIANQSSFGQPSFNQVAGQVAFEQPVAEDPFEITVVSQALVPDAPVPEAVVSQPVVAEASVPPPTKGKGKGKKKKGQTEEVAVALDVSVPPSSVADSAPRPEEFVGLPPMAPQPTYALDFFDPASAPPSSQPVYQSQPQDPASVSGQVPGQAPGQPAAPTQPLNQEPESPYQAPSVPIPSPTFKPVVPAAPAHPQAFVAQSYIQPGVQSDVQSGVQSGVQSDLQLDPQLESQPQIQAAPDDLVVSTSPSVA
ncbi:MAG: UvrD-helicase domain-containing protein, partial [Candidatus Obscuribacterales bacterium]